MSAGIIRRPLKHRANRRKNLPAVTPQPSVPILVSSVAAATPVLTLTFDQPVSLTGTPGFRIVGSTAVPISAAQTAANKVAITYSASFMASSVNVGVRDPAIRNASGGYVTATLVPAA